METFTLSKGAETVLAIIVAAALAAALDKIAGEIEYSHTRRRDAQQIRSTNI